jgi:hypothetical protein
MITNFLQKIDRLSFGQIFLILLLAFSLGTTATLTMYLQSGKRIDTGYASSPQGPTPSTFPSPPISDPVIQGVKPYLGKPGDEVVIWGKNFGSSPSNGYVMLSGTVSKVTSWEDTEIRFVIPYTNSGIITVSNGVGEATFGKTFTVYTDETTTHLSYLPDSKSLHITNSEKSLDKVVIWDINQDKIEINLSGNQQEVVNLEQIDGISWISIFDKDNNPLPFKQEPLELKYISW